MPDPATIPTPEPPADQLAFAQAIGRAVAEALGTADVEGLSNAAAARFVGMSVSLWNSLNNRGLVPAPAELSERCPRWSRTELKAWLLAGAPARSRWNQMREVVLRRAG